jgi:hypothetical protein
MRSTRRRFALGCTALFLVGLAVPASALAQFVGTAVLESQYRSLGVALTDGKPDLRLGVSYDHPSGVYAGASLIGGETADDGIHGLGWAAYLGYAEKTANGLTWDIGATTSQINLYLPVDPLQRSADQPTGYTQTYGASGPKTYTFHYRADYSEVYGGLSWGSTSVHLYASPDYLGQSLRTAYLDVTETFRPVTHLRVYGHAGALTALEGSAGPGSDREHYDFGAGAAWELHHGEIQLSWTGITPRVQYPIGYPQPWSAVIVSVTAFL